MPADGTTAARSPRTAISARPASTATTFYATGRARETAGPPEDPIGLLSGGGHRSFQECPELAPLRDADGL